MNVDTYVARLGRRLSSLGPLALGPIREARDHLIDSKQALIDEGLAASEAEAEAVRRFGDADEIGERSSQLCSPNNGMSWNES